MATETMRSGKIVLRLKRPEDAPDDYAWRSDEELSALDATTPLKQPYVQFLRSYEENLQLPSPWSQRFAIDTLDGKHIGNCMCYDINLDYGEAEVGIMIGDRTCWDQGYGYHSMVGLIDYMFCGTSLRRLYLHTLEWNLRAQRSFEKCGFTPVRATQRDGYKFIRMELSRERWFQIRGEKLAELRQEQTAAESEAPSPLSGQGTSHPS